jgi:Ca-activated chloride channel family protein
MAAATALPSAYGAGLLIADGGLGGVLEIKEHDVQVTINNGIAVTKVTQIFQNTENRQVEALYTFPVPRGASVANFSMWINGKEMVGEVVEKKRARQIYESYKAKRVDPGLLEQTDYKTFEMRIFPINAGAEQKVEICYYQELDFDHDWATYVYPLATVTRKDIQSQVKGKFAFNIEIKSAIPLAEVESPSHGSAFVVAQHTPEYFQASLETSGGSLARDVVLACRQSRPKTGLDLVTSKTDGEDGYFTLSLTAGEDLAKLDEGMDYVFVLDISGSMGDDGKLALSRGSVNAFIEELQPGDRFEVVTFNLQPNTLFNALQAVDSNTQARAADFLASQSARGGTVLNPALNTAYKYADPDRMLNVVILSDGMTEQGERQTLLGLIGQRPRNARVFCIGVGNEVNRPLLEQMAQDSGGLAAFLSQGDNFTRAAKSFRRKLMTPVATGLQVDFNGLEVYDLEPKVLPNLYHGAPVRLYGRYRKSGQAQVSLKADIRGREFKQEAALNFPAQDEANPEIERMWAWKKMDRLLKDADRTGSRAGVVDEIVRLGEAYSIVSEYTSFLVLENDGEYKRWQIERRNALRIARDRKAQESLRQRLDALRAQSNSSVGPQQEAKQGSGQPTLQSPAGVRPMNSTPQNSSTPPAQPGRSLDFNIGTGPVGPLFLVLVFFLRRMKAVQNG